MGDEIGRNISLGKKNERTYIIQPACAYLNPLPRPSLPIPKKKRDTLIFMRKDLPTNEEEYSGLPVTIPNTQLIHHPSPSPSSHRPSSPGKIKITM